MTLKRVFLPLALVLAPALLGLAFARGWALVPVAGLVAAAVFGQVTVNETMTARYISPELRTRMYSVRFFVGFLGSAVAAPMVSVLHERTGNLESAILVLAGFAAGHSAVRAVLPRPAGGTEPRAMGAGRAPAGPGGGGIGRMRRRL